MIVDPVHEQLVSERTDDGVVVDIRDSAEHKGIELQINLPTHGEQGLPDAVVEGISADVERIGTFAQERGLPAEVGQRMQGGLVSPGRRKFRRSFSPRKFQNLRNGITN